MNNCPQCGAPPVTAMAWACGTKYSFTTYKVTPLCKVRTLYHKIAILENKIEIYEEAVFSVRDEKAFIAELERWYRNTVGAKPVHLIVQKFFRDREAKRDE